MPYQERTVAVIIPAHNEQESIGIVIAELMALTNTQNHVRLIDDIVVCDNASTDKTAEIAISQGARLVYESQLGYGSACLRAIQAILETPPDIVIFVDADHSVVSEELTLLLQGIEQGADLVIGSRVLGEQQKQALTPQQRFGNYLASYLIRKLWQQPITDLGPFRAIKYSSLVKLKMADKAFGWTVEMQVKAMQAGLVIKEVPVTSLKRIGRSKISGTLRGTIGAARGILGKIFHLYRHPL